MLSMVAGDTELPLPLHCVLSFCLLSNLEKKIIFHFEKRRQCTLEQGMLFLSRSQVLSIFQEIVRLFWFKTNYNHYSLSKLFEDSFLLDYFCL